MLRDSRGAGARSRTAFIQTSRLTSNHDWTTVRSSSSASSSSRSRRCFPRVLDGSRSDVWRRADRLGGGVVGALRAHAWFGGVDWSALGGGGAPSPLLSALGGRLAEQAQHGAADAQTTLGALDQPLDGADEAEPFAFRW